MMGKVAATIAFLIAANGALAQECHCLPLHGNVYERVACPVVDSSVVPAPALVPPLDYREAMTQDVLKILGVFARAQVCIAVGVAPRVSLRTTRIQPWPQVLRRLAERLRVTPTYTQGLIVLRSPLSERSR